MSSDEGIVQKDLVEKFPNLMSADSNEKKGKYFF